MITLDVKIPPSLVTSLQKAPAEFVQGAMRGMTKGTEVTASRVQEKRLTGQGPFPPEQHRLGQRSSQLYLSVRTVAARLIDSSTIETGIGSPVKYAAVHEFGFRREVPSKRSKSGTRKMNLPERAPFRTGIAENFDYIAGEISQGAERAVQETIKE